VVDLGADSLWNEGADQERRGPHPRPPASERGQGLGGGAVGGAGSTDREGSSA
jgi:hypothetical protein